MPWEVTMDIWGDNRVSKRLGTKDKQMLYLNAKKRCENCGKKLNFVDMEIGYKNQAYSIGGRTTLVNSVCLCHDCKKKQGTDDWATFQKKQGKQDSKTMMKKSLQALSITQLKALAEKHKITVNGTMVYDSFETRKKAPTKSQYVTKLASVVTEKEISSAQIDKLMTTLKKK
jgi:hypothetical protein